MNHNGTFSFSDSTLSSDLNCSCRADYGTKDEGASAVADGDRRPQPGEHQERYEKKNRSHCGGSFVLRLNKASDAKTLTTLD